MEKQEVQDRSSSFEEFNAIVSPLEAKVGRRLSGPGRSTCVQAFTADPERFSSLAADALQRGRNPLALLIRMVADGDHLAEPPPAPAVAGPGTNGVCTHDGCQDLDHCYYATRPLRNGKELLS